MVTRPYSDQASAAIARALRDAHARNQDVTIEDLAIGLLSESSSELVRAFDSLGVQTTSLLDDLLTAQSERPGPARLAVMGLTPLARDVLRQASRRARRHRRRRITSGEILYSLSAIRLVGLGAALRRLGTSRRALRRTLRRVTRRRCVDSELVFAQSFVPRRGVARFDLTLFAPRRAWRWRLRRLYRREVSVRAWSDLYRSIHDMTDDCPTCQLRPPHLVGVRGKQVVSRTLGHGGA